MLLFDLVPFPQINGDLGTNQIPTAQAHAAAVAVAQQHRQFEGNQAASVQQSPNSSSQATSMASPPLPGRMSPHLQMSGQSPTQQTATHMTQPSAAHMTQPSAAHMTQPSAAHMTQPSASPHTKQAAHMTQPSASPHTKQVAGQLSPKPMKPMMTPPRSHGKTPPRESGKNLPMVNTTQAQSPASQGDPSNSSGYASATESKPNIQSQLLSVKSEPSTPPPPPTHPQKGKVHVCPLCYCLSRAVG